MFRNRKAFFALILIGGLLWPTLHGRAANDFVENTGGYTINWTTGLLAASGSQDMEKNEAGEFIDTEKALAAARQTAQNNLLKAAKSVRISGTTDVEEFAGHDPKVMAQLTEMIKNASVSSQQYTTDGRVAVFMEMSFFGGFSQLVLPKEIQHVEPITSLTKPKEGPSPVADEAVDRKDPKKEIFSGLVVDARGLGMLPVLSPRILDENHTEVYGPAFISREIAVQKGICLYESDMASAKTNARVLEKPLLVKALRVKQAGSSELVISNTDALKIRSASEHLAFLKQCRVILVIDRKH